MGYDCISFLLTNKPNHPPFLRFLSPPKFSYISLPFQYAIIISFWNSTMKNHSFLAALCSTLTIDINFQVSIWMSKRSVSLHILQPYDCHWWRTIVQYISRGIDQDVVLVKRAQIGQQVFLEGLNRLGIGSPLLLFKAFMLSGSLFSRSVLKFTRSWSSLSQATLRPIKRIANNCTLWSKVYQIPTSISKPLER